MDLQRNVLIAHRSVSDIYPTQVAEIRMGGRIVSAKIIDQGFGAVQSCIQHDIRSVYNAAPYFLHVAAFYIIQFFIHIRQRRRRGKQRRCLGIGQVVVLQRKQNVLPHNILIGVVQNLLRRLGQQPVPELLLFRKHLPVKGGVPLFIGHLSGSSFFWGLSRAGFSAAAAFSPANTEGRCSSCSTSGSSRSGSGRPSMFSKASSSARREDFSASSASLGKGFSTSTCAASRC